MSFRLICLFNMSKGLQQYASYAAELCLLFGSVLCGNINSYYWLQTVCTVSSCTLMYVKLHLYLLAVILFLISFSYPHSNYCFHTYN